MSDNPFAFDEDEVEETERKESNPVKQLRDALKAAQKEAKESKKELEELRAFKSDYERRERAQSATQAFSKLGLNEKHAELFVKLNPEAELTEEAVKTFATEYGLPVTEQATTDETTPEEAPFAPADVGSSGEGYISRQQLDEMYKSNPQRAIGMLRSGRVRWNNPDDN